MPSVHTQKMYIKQTTNMLKSFSHNDITRKKKKQKKDEYNTRKSSKKKENNKRSEKGRIGLG